MPANYSPEDRDMHGMRQNVNIPTGDVQNDAMDRSEYNLSEPHPYDKEGLPMLRAKGGHPLDSMYPGISLNLGSIFGVDGKGVPHNHPIPAYVVPKGDTERYWYPLGGIVKYLEGQSKISGKDKLKWAGTLDHLKKVHTKATADVNMRRSNGESVPDFENQPSPKHAGFHIAAQPLALGRPVVGGPNTTAPGQILGTSSSLEGAAALAYGDSPRPNPTNPGAPTVSRSDWQKKFDESR